LKPNPNNSPAESREVFLESFEGFAALAGFHLGWLFVERVDQELLRRGCVRDPLFLRIAQPPTNDQKALLPENA